MFNKSPNIILFLVTFTSYLLLVGCEQKPELLKIQFTPYFGNKEVFCNQPIKIENNVWRLSQMQLFISNLKLQDTQSHWHNITFETQIKDPKQIKNPKKESNQVALVGGICNQAMNWQIAALSPISSQNIKAISFNVGVPFELNHKNPITQPSPLNQADMFWVWQTGYKFLRLELASDDSEWIFHLGSTGCQSASPVRPPQSRCKNPNYTTIKLEKFNAKKPIIIDLKKLLVDIDLKKDNNCQSDESNPLCQTLIKRMGINHSQQVFNQ